MEISILNKQTGVMERQVYAAVREGDKKELSWVALNASRIMRKCIYPLHVAVELDNIDSLMVLIDNGYPLDQNSKYWGTPLHLAIRRGKYEIARLLIKKGANMTRRNENEENGLSLTAHYGSEPFIKFVWRMCLNKCGNAVINGRYGNKRETLLAMICNNYSINPEKVMRPLLVNGANINQGAAGVPYPHESNIIMINLAATQFNFETTRLLTLVLALNHAKKLRPSFNINLQDQAGNTLFHYLCARGNYVMVKKLIETIDIKINIKSNDKKTPLNMAIENNHIGIVKLLINAGCEFKSKGLWCDVFPFDQAVHDEAYRVASMLVEAGFDIKESENYKDIIKGHFPRIRWRKQNSNVRPLFHIVRDKIRSCISGNQNINQCSLSKLGLPPNMVNKLNIFPNFPPRWRTRGPNRK